MVFINPDSLGQIVKLFTSTDSLHHAELAVKDWFSNNIILGMHVFSNQCQWIASPENLFVDIDPLAPTPKKTYWQFPAPVVDHCPNPSPFQSFHFGIHRALKTIQTNSTQFNWFQHSSQWQLLNHVWSNFKARKDVRLGQVILGADLVLKGLLDQRHYDYTDRRIEKIFQRFEKYSASVLRHTLSKDWEEPVYARQIRLKERRRNPFGFFRYLMRKTVSQIKT
jgi:hypothetical protein